jgi:hypothetical protein
MLRRLTIAALLMLPMLTASLIPAVRAQQGDKVIERLHPRLESAPEVLFAAAPTLPPGDYSLHSATTLQATKAIEGDMPFKVSD